jgi:hypothetical protein
MGGPIALAYSPFDHLAFDSQSTIWMQSSHGETEIYPFD